MKDKKLILATDLDGTFLEGPHQGKKEFYDVLRQAKETVSVVFVTGRSLGLVKGLYNGGFDFILDYIIANHGSIVVKGDSLDYVEEL